MIQYTKGDATDPIRRTDFIVHICNDVGGWGAGFVLALSNRWPEPEAQYRRWAADRVNNRGDDFELGQVSYVDVGSNLWVVNMIAQHGTRHDADGNPPIRYDALERCLDKVALQCLLSGAAVHMPRIGCGLGGSTWEDIEPIVQRTLIDHSIPVTVYDFA